MKNFQETLHIFFIFGPIPLKIELLIVHGSCYMEKLTFLENLHFFDFFRGRKKCWSKFSETQI